MEELHSPGCEGSGCHWCKMFAAIFDATQTAQHNIPSRSHMMGCLTSAIPVQSSSRKVAIDKTPKSTKRNRHKDHENKDAVHRERNISTACN